MHKILSICGSGIATSTLVAERLKAGLEEHGIIDVSITEANISEASGIIQNNPPDMVISTTALDSVDLSNIKNFDGLPILMNINTASLYEEIANFLKQK